LDNRIGRKEALFINHSQSGDGSEEPKDSLYNSSSPSDISDRLSNATMPVIRSASKISREKEKLEMERQKEYE
jgi:hypothetical protein